MTPFIKTANDSGKTRSPMPLKGFLTRLIWYCVLPLVLLSVLFGINQIYTLKNHQKQDAENLVNTVATAVDRQLAQQLAALQVLASSPLLDSEEQRRDFYNSVSQFRNQFGGDIILADLSMQMLINTREPFGTKLPKLPKPAGYAAAPAVLKTGQPAVGDVFTGPIAMKQMVALAVPVTRNHQTRYLLLSIIETGKFRFEHVTLPDGWTMTLRDSIGKTIAIYPDNAQTKPDNPALHLVAGLKNSNWTVTLDISRNSYYLPIARTSLLFLASILLATLASALGGKMAGQKLASSVNALAVDQGPNHQEQPIAEIEAVRNRLLIAATERVQAETSLRLSEERYRSMFEYNHAVMLVIDPDSGNIVDANPAAAAWYGWSRPELCRMQINQINTLTLDQIKQEMELARSLQRRHFNFKHRKADGSVRDVEVFSGRVPVAGRTLLYSIVHDITDQKRAEQELTAYHLRLEELVEGKTRALAESQQALLNVVDDLNAAALKLTSTNQELELANQELESFSYSVSHDLRAPLRHLTGFAELLEKSLEGTLDEKGRHYLKVISDSAQQMNSLIENLLSFSRLGRVAMSETRVHMNQLVKEALDIIKPETTGREIVWELADLPDVKGDPSLLWLVVTNLLGNAVKFTRNIPVARISVSCNRQKHDELVFAISDNGAGFDMRYSDRLFNVFQRLHRVEEFEGTGIGLANVKRIIMRHGGRVWAESAVGKGATFYFSLTGFIEEQ